MDACQTCGTVRHRAGVLFPVRRLCNCESRLCHCGKPAIFVEFQSPIKSTEPKIPAKSNEVAEFTCTEHAPDDAPLSMDSGISKTADSAVLPAKRVKRPAVTSGPLNLDPLWSYPPPTGATSSHKVRCTNCDDAHALRDRVMWNGSESYCPKCNNRMYVHDWESDE